MKSNNANSTEQSERKCYQCHKEIPNVEVKYFCSKECWDIYGKSYKPLKKTKADIQTIQKRLSEMGKEVKPVKTAEEIAKEVGLI